MILDDKGEVVSTKFGYEGSQAVSRHRNWLSTTSPVDISEEQVLPFAQRNTLVSHLYELYRNDPVCFAIVESIVTNVASPKLISNTGDDEYDAEKERLFARWFNNCETTGFSLPEVLRLVLRELCLAGEVFLMLGPSKLMLIEANRIASDPKNKKKQEVEGIVINSEGRATSYRVCGFDDRGRLDVTKGKYVSARNCIHVASRNRISSIRGTPWLSSSISLLKDIQELVKASVSKAKISSLLSAFVKSETSHHQMHNVGGYDEPLRSSHTKLATGAVMYLEPNEDIKIIQGGDIGNLDDFIEMRISDVLATLGLSIEALRSFSKSSYASSRATRSMLANKFGQYREMLETKLLNRVQFWYSSKLVKEGMLNQTDGIDNEAINWSWKAIPSLDVQKDALTHSTLLKNGMSNLAEIQNEKGKDWQATIEGRAQELRYAQDMADKYGVNPSLLLPEYQYDQPLQDEPIDEVDSG
jgi:capsid protein